MIPLTDKEKESYEKQKFCYTCKQRLTVNNKKVRDHCHFTGNHRGPAHSKCNMNHKISTNIPVVFHNDFKYDYYFIIKELAKEFERQFKCLGENTEKYITFSALINKEITKTDKDNKKNYTNTIQIKIY